MNNIDKDFAEWAFGEEWAKFYRHGFLPVELMSAWNKEHGALLRLRYEGNVIKDLAKMKEIWRNFVSQSDAKVRKIPSENEEQSTLIPCRICNCDERANVGENKTDKSRGEYGQKNAQSERANQKSKLRHQKGKAKVSDEDPNAC
jgi:hypothetical protein